MQIPRVTESQVDRTITGTPRMSGASPMGGALQDVGSAITKVGSGFTQMAIDRYHEAGELAATKAVNEHDLFSGTLEQDALKRVGEASQDIDTPLKQYREGREKIRKTLTDDYQRQIFDSHTNKEDTRFQLNLHRHAETQFKGMQLTNAAARVEIQTKKLEGIHYQDADIFKQQLADTKAAKMDELAFKGYTATNPATAEVVKNAIENVESDAYSSRISQAISKGDNATAKVLFGEYKDKIEATKREKIEKHIKTIDDVATVDKMINEVKSEFKDENPDKEITPDAMIEAYNKKTADPAHRKLGHAEIKEWISSRNQGVRQRFGETSGKIYIKAHESWDKDQPVSIQSVKASDEYNSLSSAEQAKVLDKVLTENKAAIGRKKQARRDVLEERKFRKEEWDKNYNFYNTNPELLARMTKEEMLGIQNDVSHADYKALVAKREKLTSPKELARAKIESSVIDRAFSKVTDEKQKADYARAAERRIADRQRLEKRQLTPEEIEAETLKGAQEVAYKESHIWGDSVKVKPMVAIKKGEQLAVPSPEVKKAITAQLAKTGRKPPTTDERWAILHALYLKQKEGK